MAGCPPLPVDQLGQPMHERDFGLLFMQLAYDPRVPEKDLPAAVGALVDECLNARSTEVMK